MTDLVERLRDVSRGGWPDADEAAAEIERLRARLEMTDSSRRNEVKADIVDRLRESSVTWSKDTLIGQAQARMEAAAASEIERLRIEVESLQRLVRDLADVVDARPS
jgi:hypothetical protein